MLLLGGLTLVRSFLENRELNITIQFVLMSLRRTWATRARLSAEPVRVARMCGEIAREDAVSKRAALERATSLADRVHTVDEELAALANKGRGIAADAKAQAMSASLCSAYPESTVKNVCCVLSHCCGFY